MVTIMFIEIFNRPQILPVIEKKTYKKKSTAKIVLDFKKVHKDTYIYDEVEYLGSNEKVKIRCRKHGVFLQLPFHHKNGKGCKQCGNEKQRSDFEEVKKQFNKKHLNRYNYDNSKYINNYTKIEVVCLNHGSFLVRPSKHLEGFGCPDCRRRQKVRINHC